MNPLIYNYDLCLFAGCGLFLLGILGQIIHWWRNFKGTMERKRLDRWYAISLFCICLGVLEIGAKILEGTCLTIIGMITFYVEYKSPKDLMSKATWTHKGILGIGIYFILFGMLVIFIKFCRLCGIHL